MMGRKSRFIEHLESSDEGEANNPSPTDHVLAVRSKTLANLEGKNMDKPAPSRHSSSHHPNTPRSSSSRPPPLDSTPMTNSSGIRSFGKSSPRTPTSASSGSSKPLPPPPPRQLASHTIDRVGSILGPPQTPLDKSTDSATLAALNVSQGKIVENTTALVSEISMRLGMKLLPTAQAQVRLETLRLDRDQGEFQSDAHLAHALLQESFGTLSRLEAICENLRRCDNKPACCECALPVCSTIGPLFTVADLICGRSVQSFMAECSARFKNPQTGECEEKKQMRAVWDGLDPFFQSWIGQPFDPNKAKYTTQAGFLEAWRTMTEQPGFLNMLDSHLIHVQANALDKRDRGEHADQPKLKQRLTNLFSGQGRKGSRGE